MRHDIVQILGQLLNDELDIKDFEVFRARYGILYEFAEYLKLSEWWESIKELYRQGGMTASLVLGDVAELILGLMDDMLTKQPQPNGAVDSETYAELAAIIQNTIDLWGRELNTALIEKGHDIGTMVNNHEDEKSSAAMDLVATTIDSRLRTTLEKVNSTSEVLEMISLLFPGRYWDYSVTDLQLLFLKNLARYARMLGERSKIAEILDLLGKMEIEEGAKRMVTTHMSKDEIYSIHNSNELERILPAELAKLGNATLKLLFYADFLESKLMTYEMKGRNWVGGPPRIRRKGPVIAVVDTSGSMHGDPELLAKALVLLLARRMIKEQRPMKVILFSSTEQAVEYDLTEKSRMGDDFLQFLYLSFGGGTDFNTAVRSCMEKLQMKEWSASDVVFISDGLAEVDDKSIKKQWDSLKMTSDTRLFSLIVGNDRPGGLKEISTELFYLSSVKGWDREKGPARLVNEISLVRTH